MTFNETHTRDLFLERTLGWLSAPILSVNTSVHTVPVHFSGRAGRPLDRVLWLVRLAPWRRLVRRTVSVDPSMRAVATAAKPAARPPVVASPPDALRCKTPTSPERCAPKASSLWARAISLN